MRMFALAAAAALALSAPALAQECTEELAQQKSEALFAYMEANPDKAENVERYVKEVEEEYGGEPSEAQTCDALDKLLAKIEAGG